MKQQKPAIVGNVKNNFTVNQIYCNDNCRNTFNKNKAKQKKIEPHPNQKAIFKIIKRNYDIMQRAYPQAIRPERYEYVTVQTMDKDFDPDFFTSIHQTNTGLWYVCFDRGWQVIGERYHMKDFPEKNGFGIQTLNLINRKYQRRTITHTIDN